MDIFRVDNWRVGREGHSGYFGQAVNRDKASKIVERSGGVDEVSIRVYSRRAVEI